MGYKNSLQNPKVTAQYKNTNIIWELLRKVGGGPY